MKSRSGHNRAICAGDKARFSFSTPSPVEIRARVSQWSTSYLESFLFKCESAPWRQAIAAELKERLQPKTKKVPKKQRNKRPKLNPR